MVNFQSLDTISKQYKFEEKTTSVHNASIRDYSRILYRYIDSNFGHFMMQSFKEVWDITNDRVQIYRYLVRQSFGHFIYLQNTVSNHATNRQILKDVKLSTHDDKSAGLNLHIKLNRSIILSSGSLSMRPLATCCGASYGSRPPRWGSSYGLPQSDLTRARAEVAPLVDFTWIDQPVPK